MKCPKMFYVWDELGEFEPMNGEKVMISAGSAWNNPGEGFTAWIPDFDELFVDSGGFQVASNWGEYPFSPREYMDWAESIGADYVAGMDLACERGLGDTDVSERMERTIQNQIEQMETFEEGNYSFELVPIVQGSTETNQYLESVDRLKDHDLIEDYMGVGSLCMRKSVNEIYEIVKSVKKEIDSRLHLFGVKISVLKDRRFWGLFHSSDTAAWKFMPRHSGGKDRIFVKDKEDKIFAFNRYREKVESYQNAIQKQTQLAERLER